MVKSWLPALLEASRGPGEIVRQLQRSEENQSVQCLRTEKRKCIKKGGVHNGGAMLRDNDDVYLGC
jgi:hypothetical protein